MAAYCLVAVGALLPGATAFVAPLPLPARDVAAQSRLGNLVTASAQPRRWTTRPSTAVQLRSMRMLKEPTGADAFEEFGSEVSGNPVRATVSKWGPKLAKTLTTGIVPAAGLVGYLLVPTSQIAVSALGAGVSAVAALKARQKLLEERRASAPGRVAQHLQEFGVGNVTPEELAKLMDGYGLEEEERREVLANLFVGYFMAMLRNMQTKTQEIKELAELRDSLGLDGELMGQCLKLTAEAVHKKYVEPASAEDLRDPWSPDRMAIDKFLFLTDRLLEVSDTEEAYLYEMGRIQQVLDLAAPQVRERCLAVATPFYEKALDVVLSNLDNVKPDNLLKAQKTLGITEKVAKEMNIKFYREQTNAALAAAGKKGLSAAEQGRLNKMASVLGIEATKGVKLVASSNWPFFEQEVSAVFADVEGSLKDLPAVRKRFLNMSSRLKLDPQRVATLLRLRVASRFTPMMSTVARHVAAAQDEQAYEAIKRLVTQLSGGCTLAAEIEAAAQGLHTDPETDYFEIYYQPPPMQSRTMQGYQEVYMTFFRRVIQDDRVDAEEEKDLKLLARILSIETETGTSLYRQLTGPQIKELMTEAATKGDFSAESKDKILELMVRLKVPQQLWAEVGMQVYKEQLEKLAAKNRIYTAEEKQHLDQLQSFLGLDQKLVDDELRKAGAALYGEAVKDAMSHDGTIDAEYREGLNKLRERLGLTEEHTQEVFYSAMAAKLETMLQNTVEVFERSQMTKEQLAAQKGDMAGEDVLLSGRGDVGNLGITATKSLGSVEQDITALVAFYEDNGVLIKDTEGGEFSTGYKVPINSKGLIKEQQADALYRYYLGQTFLADEAKAKKMVEAVPKLATILGLEKRIVNRIHDNMALTAVDRFLRAQHRVKNSLEAQDYAFLLQIQSRLSLEERDFQNILKTVKKNIVLDKSMPLTKGADAAGARGLRELAVGMGADLEEDLGMAEVQRAQLFAVEAEAAVISGAITATDKDLLFELQEGWNLTEETAEKAFLRMLGDRAQRNFWKSEQFLESNHPDNQKQFVEIFDDVMTLLRVVDFNLDRSIVSWNKDQRQRAFGIYRRKKADDAGKPGLTEEQQGELDNLAEFLRLPKGV